MLPGSGQCDLRLLIPDAGIGQKGFHDVVIKNLLGTSNWRANFVTPADAIGLRQRWSKAVFQVMRERSVEMEDIRRLAYTGNEPAYRYTGRGYCPVCVVKSDYGLDVHMMCHHLGLGQLWRCPVEWCAVWKGSVRECRDHFNEKHSGSETLDFDKVSKTFPAWTVSTRCLESGTEAGGVRNSGGCKIIPRSRKTISTQVPGVPGPLAPPGAPERKDNQAGLVGQPSHGHC